MGSRENIRLDVLARPGLGGVVVLGHVAAATAARRDDGRLEGGRLEVLDLEGRLAGFADVARTATARRLEVRHVEGYGKGLCVVGFVEMDGPGYK
jgi:hypothetical protein